ncbi:MAG: radical SAM protein [Oscillospiraceae bacterium]|nr:radical SAM protein [Oscillospiraceae bacterium]
METADIDFLISPCRICPRKCGADRQSSVGFCGAGKNPRVAKAYLHMWEEPCISGTRGSGTVFFSGCSLKCCYCQNYKISAESFGADISPKALGDIFLRLRDKGAHNINLVTPTHYIPQIIIALDSVKHRLDIPIVYNTGGYDSVSSLKLIDDYIDIYLTDIKYRSSVLSKKYSDAEDYFDVASAAAEFMISQKGKPVFDESGLMKSGVIIRHMVLPSCRRDSEDILDYIHSEFGCGSFLLSLMSQYTPFYRSSEHKEINRRISTYEYECVVEKARELGFEGYMQERSSAKEEYTPDFDLSGVFE